MATNVVYNVFNGDDCAFESMTKEQIYELIANSIAQGELAGVNAENPFITRIKEQNKGVPLTFWVGTQAEFNAIEEKAENCFYIITDSTAQEDIENDLEELKMSIDGLDTTTNKANITLDIIERLFPSFLINYADGESGGRFVSIEAGLCYKVACFDTDNNTLLGVWLIDNNDPEGAKAYFKYGTRMAEITLIYDINNKTAKRMKIVNTSPNRSQITAIIRPFDDNLSYETL